MISEDFRATGDARGNWLKAEDVLTTRRRELILPPEETPVSPPDEEVTPEAPEPETTPSSVSEPELTSAPEPVSESDPEPEPATPAPETAPSPPITPSLDDLLIDAYLVDRTEDVYTRATEETEAQIRGEMNRGRWFSPRKWMRNIKLRVAEEFYRQKGIQELAQAKKDNGNAYLSTPLFRNAAVQSGTIAQEQQELEGFLNQHVPQAQEVFTDAFREFRDMYLGNVAASRNAPESTTDQTN